MSGVLLVEDNPRISELLEELVAHEGYQVMTLLDTSAGAVQAVVERLEPVCVLLDSAGRAEYGESWDVAIWLRRRSVPTVMMTGHRRSAEEARAGVTPRSQAAAFAAVLLKPFDPADLGVVIARILAGNRANSVEP
jgi:DNA-binding response OmpR family regulator